MTDHEESLINVLVGIEQTLGEIRDALLAAFPADDAGWEGLPPGATEEPEYRPYQRRSGQSAPSRTRPGDPPEDDYPEMGSE
jgi:hypothetical protein